MHDTDDPLCLSGSSQLTYEESGLDRPCAGFYLCSHFHG